MLFRSALTLLTVGISSFAGRGGGGAPVIINPGGGSGGGGGGGGGGFVRDASITPGVVIGGVLLAAVGVLYFTSGRRQTTTTAPTNGLGNLRQQLYGRGAYGTSQRDAPERLSYEQFTSRRGPNYDLEVGR